ncbi:MAG TPA: hypothetical protein VMY78_17055 [Solirubrobacteraceae bacterium]|nr:hypothetical protein [Solirubrobacteraceae bacterium]
MRGDPLAREAQYELEELPPETAVSGYDAAEAIERILYDHRERVASAADRSIAAARGLALHEYRDESRRARLDLARTIAAEAWPHRLYRKVRRRPVPLLATPARAAPVLDAWRKQSSMSAGERAVWPTTRPSGPLRMPSPPFARSGRSAGAQHARSRQEQLSASAR